MRFRILVIGLIGALCAPAQETRQAESRPATIPFVIVHTNDVHGQIRPIPDPRVRGDDAPLVGGYQELVAAIDEERARVRHSILVDGGDWYQGTPEGTLSEGQCAIELMNAAGYDFAVIGNHEFDSGRRALANMLDLARFRVFARNLRLPDSPEPGSPAGAAHDLGWHINEIQSATPAIVTAAGMRIALDGMLPEDTPQIVTPGVFEGLVVEGEVACARRIKESVARIHPGADALVLINHVGKDHNVLIAREVPGIDVIIGGHNHRDVLENGVTVPSTGTLIAQAGASTTSLGIVTLEIDPAARKIVSKKARLRRIQPDPTLRVPRVAPIIDRYERSVADVMNAVVATSERPLPRDHDLVRPSPLGNWLTQVMLDRTGAQIAIHNVTGVRASIPAGPVRVRDFFQVSPFGNRLAVVTLRINDLKALLERNATSTAPGCFVRGVSVYWKDEAEGRRKVVKLVLKGRELRDDEAVTVVTTDFLAAGSSSFQAFRNAIERRDSNVTLFDATVEAARAQKELRAPDDNPWIRAEPE